MPTALRQNLVADTLAHLTIGPSVRTELLEMVPLLSTNGHGPAEPGYDLAGPAFSAGTLRVTEVSEGGTVPFLQVENAGPRPVLLLDGEELIGAKQNRVLNVTVLVAAKTVTKVLVRSHAADALDRRLDLPHVANDAAEFLAMVSALAERQVDGVGLGKEVRLEGETLVGSGLAVEDRLVHLSVLVG